MKTVLQVICAWALAAHCAGAKEHPGVIERHEETQRLMAECMAAAQGLDASLSDRNDVRELTFHRKLNELMALARLNGPRFIQQVLLLESRKDWGELSPAMAFLREDAQLSANDFAAALAPLLYCDDESIRKRAREWFPRVFGRGCPYGHPNMSHLADCVKGKHLNPQIAMPLQRALFEVDSNGAFLFFHTTAKPQEFISLRRAERTIANVLYEKQYLGGLSERTIDTETAQIVRELAESDYWWARLFIAELMVQNREFRQVDLIATLREDENPLVRQSVGSIDEPDSLRMTPVDGQSPKQATVRPAPSLLPNISTKTQRGPADVDETPAPR
jgi:hypothetical protein